MKNNTTKSVFAYSTLGIQLALIMVLFVLGGYKLDQYCNSSPWFVLLGAFVGMGSGLYNLIKGLQQMDKMSNEDRQNKKNRNKWL